MKAGGGAKRNASLERGAQVSTATQRAATTQSLRPSEVLGKGEGTRELGVTGDLRPIPNPTKHLPPAQDEINR